MHYAWGISVNCYNYYVYYGLYQLLRQLLYSSFLLSSVMDTILSSSVLPLRSLESVVRYSSAVLYTLDMISRYFYAGLDRCSQIRHSRWMLLLFSDLSHSPDLITSQIRHLRRTLLSLTNSSAGFGYILLVEFVERPSSR